MVKNRWKQSNRCCQSESSIPNRLGTEILSFIFLSLGMSEISFHHWSGTDNLLPWVSQHLFSAQIFLHVFPLRLSALGFWSLCESSLGLSDVLIESIFWLEGFCWVTAASPLPQRFNHGVPQPLPDTVGNSIFEWQNTQKQSQDHPVRQSTGFGMSLPKYFRRFQPLSFHVCGFLVAVYNCINCAGKNNHLLFSEVQTDSRYIYSALLGSRVQQWAKLAHNTLS